MARDPRLAGQDPRGPALALATVIAAAAGAALSGPSAPGSTLPWAVNPTGYLSGGVCVILWLLSIPAKELLNLIFVSFAERFLGMQRIDVGDGRVNKLEVLEAIDLSYLALNTVIEFLGMSHLIAFLIGEHVEHKLEHFNVLSGPVAFLLIMIANDVIYYPVHLIAHRRFFYPYCHKQHHRQFLPFRGYADAANQHPIEQMYGFCILIVCLRVASATVGLHAATAWCVFLGWAMFNIANHLAYDSWVHLPMPYPAFVRDHQMHHRFPQCNYSTLTSMCDRLFGTFRAYQPLSGAPTRPPVLDRPEALPSPCSVIGLAVFLALAGVVVELVRTGSLPPLAATAKLVPSCIGLGAVALGIAAATVAAAKFSGGRSVASDAKSD
mmetsp:Transcript_8784/g.19302  ORF Transcript_8784/g.19302 Transcript_8784/m.19302 type:complete len:381 (-) Transcript_8784:284-1426(-)